MSLSLAKPKIRAPRILAYGPEGVGKSTMGAQAFKPVFLPTESGLTAMTEIPQFPQAKTYDEFMDFLKEVYLEDHDYKTLVVDSLDWLEPLIWAQVCKESGVTNIEDANGGYGKWVNAALDLWRDYLSKLDQINIERDMAIIQIAHAQIKRFDGPDQVGYDRYSIKLQESKTGTGAAPLMFEYHDIVLFANFYVGITKDKLAGSTIKNPKERIRGVGTGERVLYTEERPAFRCKNRFGLPDQIPFDSAGNYWDVLAEHIPYFKQLKGN